MDDLMQMQDDLDLNNAFSVIVSIEKISGVTNEIAKLVRDNQLTKESLEKILHKHKIKAITDLKEELLDLILVYVNIILNDNALSQKELRNVKLLKMLFRIKEGDFYNYRHDSVKEVLHKQLMRIYRNDDRIDENESLYKVDLQELFTLSYDQFLEFANEEDFLALEKGSYIEDLDTVIPKSKSLSTEFELRNRLISQEVKDLVWKRDGGKCVLCGSNEKLEFDHIIPIIKGGSNTYRNIQLLCEPCNRQKSANL